MTCICFVILLLGVVIYKYSSINEQADNDFRIDKEPILNRFPKIGDIQSCYWKADIKRSNSRITAPAPSSYWMKGFVYLNEKEAERLKNQLNWSSVEKDWSPTLKNESILNLSSLEWYYSEDYNNYIKPSTFIGKFYINFENSLIYFDVEK
jgi:hypothetical protein